MTRRDTYLDGMLRHLGAAYYESLHGRATRADVVRALDTVEEHLGEAAREPGPGVLPAAEPGAAKHVDGRPLGRWARRVSDVMTTSVVTVDRATPYKEIARLLAKHRISGLPVLMTGRQVAGVVTEADLLAAQNKTSRRIRMDTVRRRWRRARGQREHPALTAGELMTSPAITINLAATVCAAARFMNTHHVRRLPVVDSGGALAGIVTRRDLLGVFLRPDAEIAADVRQVLGDILPADPVGITAAVRNGVVTLTGAPRPESGQYTDLLPVVIRLVWDIDGVVDVVNRLGQAQAAAAAR